MLSKVQKNYGKTPAELKDEADAFDCILPGNASNFSITGAFRRYAQSYQDVPAPSQIANIIDHGYPEPKDGRFVLPTQTEI